MDICFLFQRKVANRPLDRNTNRGATANMAHEREYRTLLPHQSPCRSASQGPQTATRRVCWTRFCPPQHTTSTPASTIIVFDNLESSMSWLSNKLSFIAPR